MKEILQNLLKYINLILVILMDLNVVIVVVMYLL